FSSFLSVLTHKKRFRHKNRLWKRLSPQPEKEPLLSKKRFFFQSVGKPFRVPNTLESFLILANKNNIK
ncbi:hypothetical protein ABE42_35875, partial [Bacillus thuringiensis]|nr:hypothetical protein [Bacillus thuringiensis]